MSVILLWSDYMLQRVRTNSGRWKGKPSYEHVVAQTFCDHVTSQDKFLCEIRFRLSCKPQKFR